MEINAKESMREMKRGDYRVADYDNMASYDDSSRCSCPVTGV
jgi:hypothetical protein